MLDSTDVIRARVIECVQKALGSKGQLCCSDETRLIEDLGFDSLKFVEFLTDLEDELSFIITGSDFRIENFSDVGKTTKYVSRRLAHSTSGEPESGKEYRA